MPNFKPVNPQSQEGKRKNASGKEPKTKKGAPVYCAFPKVNFEEALIEEYQPY
jgi:hypothetical protein